MDAVDYRHSTEFPSEVWETCKSPTQFRPRLSKYGSIADEACWDVRDEMAAAGGSESIIRGVGCFDESSQALLESLESTAQDNKDSQERLIMKSIQARFSVEALEMDEAIGTWLLQVWKKQFSIKSEEREREFNTLEQYLTFRYVEAGAEIFLVLLRFVSDTTVTREEVESVQHLSDLLFCAQTLGHDYASWQKEIDAYNIGISNSLVNAVSLLMKLRDIDEESAKKLVWDGAFEYEQRYCEARDHFIKENSPRPEILRWLRLLELSTGGNALWGATSARYHKSAPKPVRIQKTNGIVVDGTATDHPEHKFPECRHSKAMNGTMTNGSEKLTVANGTVVNRKATYARGAEDDGAPKSKRTKVNGRSTENEHGNIAKKDRHYIQDMATKGARDQLIDALNNWYHVPDTSVSIIHQVVAILHNVSLMLDDIQDNSPMRRGFPSTHSVFGVGQTINAATYMYTKGLEIATALSPEAVVALFEELKQLHIGQAHDLHETYHCQSPSVPDYFKRIEQKTGGLFRMVSKMMQREASTNRNVNIDTLMNLLGRYYQIRDDYQDITGTSVGKSASYNDLDQGTFTLPIIHALEFQDDRGITELRSIFQSGKQTNGLSSDLKRLVIKRLEETGSLEYTKGMLDGLHEELKQEIDAVEKRMGSKNWILRLMMLRLKV
ncbi:hypothetical protein OIDMADRAFT_177678 [Oidiodendron maius Zn]|uniref:Dimethylallyltranstransferase n=1 Tax=Oidiodendron maius (strain Zn) TaxID=913774 RepID=A0A0C3HMF2_OIDMZ|nr:hypothetical protein OIDMADRAFT_177678 [Oidiodendron maius Zn]